MTAGELRLGLVGPLPPPNGGMAMQMVQLARLLQQEGVSVEVLATNPPYRPAWIGRLRGLRALFRLLPYLWQVWRLAGRVDLIHLMANSGWSWQLFAAPVICLGRLRGTPVIVNYRGGEAREYLLRAAGRVRPVLMRSAAVVVPSGFLQDVFRQFDIPSRVIPNIVDVDLFSPAAEKSSGTGFSLAITRNLEPIYGLDTAIRSVAIARKRVGGLRLRIAGSGPQRDALISLVADLGLEDCVEFMGRLDREGVVSLYRTADAVLNPARVDNMPNSVLEALACGLPVISTEVGGVPYLVKDGETALLVPVDDPEAMAEAIVQLHGNQALRRQLSANGRQSVGCYTWNAVKSLWLALYREQVPAG